MEKVVSAKANEDFTLDLEFNDGSTRRFDVKPYLNIGIFTELKDLKYFENFKIVFGTVQWKNEQDFAPETLYFESVEIVNKDLAKV
jgi:Protein of unknown function (DUF2442)